MTTTDFPWAAVVTGVFTLVGTLTGVVLTQRNAAKVHRAQINEDRVNQLRSSVATLMAEGERWAAGTLVFSSRLPYLTGVEQASFLAGPGWAQHSVSTYALDEAFVDVDLRVSDAGLSDALKIARDLFLESTTEAGVALWFAHGEMPKADIRDAVNRAVEHINRFRTSLDEVRDQSGELLRVSHTRPALSARDAASPVTKQRI